MMHRWTLCVAGALVFLCFAGCSSQECEPGAVRSCTCGDNPGEAACLSDGSMWGPCSCPQSSRDVEQPVSQDSAQVPPSRSGTESAMESTRNQGDPSERALAEKVSLRFLKGWQEGRYEPLGDEFDEEMRQKFSPDAQKQGHTAVTATFGDFQSLEFVEMALVGPYKAYRFKGTFTKVPANDRPEVRVVVNDQGKVGGFWCRQWTQDIAGPPTGAGAGDQGDSTQRALAERVAMRFLKGWDAGQYEPLADEFSADMRNKFPPDAQKQGHAATAALYGSFQSLEFVEMVPIDAFKAYRFRGTFAKAQGDARPEVRIVIDDQGKVGGFFARPWSPSMM